MISIVIPTYNEEDFLPRLLESIEAQDFKDYEVIVADNHSMDDTAEIALKYGARVVEGGLPAVARNRGASVARGEYFLFLDADTFLPDGFLKGVFERFEEDYIDICIPALKPIDSKKAIYRTLFDFANTYFRLMEYIKPQGGGACIFVTKRMHKRIGGFNEKLVTSEDHDYINRASKIGRFRVYSDIFIYVSVRRFEKEGLNTYIQKIVKSAFVFFFTGKTSKGVEYEFGNFSKALLSGGKRPTKRVDRIIMYQMLHRFNRLRHRLVNQLKSMGIDESVLRFDKRHKRKS